MGYFEAALGIVGGIGKLWGASAQKNLEKDRVGLQYEDNLEKIRRREFTQEQTKGTAQARSQASGVRHTGGSTAQGYLDTMSREFKYELDRMKRFASMGKSLGLRSANYNYQARQFGAFGDIGEGVVQGIGEYTK